MKFHNILKKSLFRALTLLIGALVSTSCSDDLDVRTGLIDNLDEDFISVSFTVPELVKVDTRAGYNENALADLYVFIYNAEGGDPLQTVHYPETGFPLPTLSESNEFTLHIEKNEAVKKVNRLTVYAVGNSSDELSSFSGEIEDLENIIVTDCYNNGFRMSGKADVSDNTTVSLERLAGKVTVDKKLDVTNFTLTEFYIYGQSDKAYLTAGTTKEIPEDVQNDQKYDKNEEGFVLYALPTKTHELKNSSVDADLNDAYIYTYIVIGGQFTDKEGRETLSYYALPLYSNTLKTHFNIDPNHWYQLIIEEVMEKGAATKEDAVANPCDYVIYEIHDHTPEVFSMESDGVHELGVTRVVDLQLDSSTGEYNGKFTVKWYSARSEDYNSFNFARDIQVTITEGDDWISFSEVQKEKQPDSSITDADNFGIQYEYTITAAERYTAQTGTIHVAWIVNGQEKLKRDIKVTYNPGFNMAAACKVELIITDDNNQYTTIPDYWAFLKGEDSSNPLYGVSEDAMADSKIRNQGLHFPMPYGENAPENCWTYKYEIDFSPLTETMGDLRLESNPDITLSGVTWTPNNSENLKGTLSFVPSSSTPYDYTTGRIVFKFKYKDNENKDQERNFTLNLYHTGFFHNAMEEPYSKYLDPKDKGYYYYEVLPVEDGTYWLDRNLGAKSNKMVIDENPTSSSTTTYKGDTDAIGTFVKIGVEKTYEDPDISLEMCPPGYKIPVTSEWNSIRLSNNFMMGVETDDNSATYNTTYYQSSAGKIYFPAAGYSNIANEAEADVLYTNVTNTGDGSTGYYWTATPAPGMEKEEMGKWLRAVYINGASSSYTNVKFTQGKLNLRCMAGSKIKAQDNYYVSINVHEVTHVYLFDTTTGAAIYNFPGHAVGTENSATQWQYFSCTTAVETENTGLLFIKQKSDGTVTLYTKNGESYNIVETKFSDAIDAAIKDESKYWKLENGKYYDFCNDDNKKATRENANQSNVFKPSNEDAFIEYLNDYCTYKYVYEGPSLEFEKEYEEEEIIWLGEPKTFSNFGNFELLAYDDDFIDWKKVPSGSTIKFYIIPNGGNPQIKLFYSDNWTWIGQYGFNNHRTKSNLRVYSFTLNESEITSAINLDGLIAQFDQCILIGVTILEGSGSTGGFGEIEKGEYTLGSESAPGDNETIIWHENLPHTVWWNELKPNYDWNQLQAGDKIRIYAYPTNASDWYALSIRDSSWNSLLTGNQQVQGPFWQIDYINGYVELVMSEAIINYIKSNGFMITGQNQTVTYVTIKKD